MNRLLVWLLRGYQLLVSPMLGPSCRFYPTCSNYAIEAVKLHGAARGGWLAVRRVCRCHPWNDGGNDPVPGSPHPPTACGCNHS
jgi:putative membrane protein insertion efficiency factor